MPVEVPKEPKKYTTVYDNFKGVDFTSDASNVYRRRSPSGLNMLPDLEGKPHKRTGWGIEVPVSEFIRVFEEATEATGITEITPKRTHHFNYGGSDFLMIFNSLGVFWMKDGDETVTLAELATPKELQPGETGPNYDVSQFPPKETIGQEEVDQIADHNRSFFFEGNGIAGFYTFVGDDLYRFSEADDGNMFYWKVDPYIPVVIIGATPATGAGTNYESFNMLTDKRSVQYFGDGTADYLLPTIPASQDAITVELLNDDGEWVGSAAWNYVSASNAVVFDEGYEPPTATVDNVKITYSPFDDSENSLSHNYVGGRANINATFRGYYDRSRTVVEEYEQIKNGPWKLVRRTEGTPSDWNRYDSLERCDSPTFTPNFIWDTNSLNVKADYTGELEDAPFTAQWGAYSNNVTIKLNDEHIAEVYGQEKEAVGEWADELVWETRSGWVDSSGNYGYSRTVTTVQTQERLIEKTKSFNVRIEYTAKIKRGQTIAGVSQRDAFTDCKKTLTFGNNIYNQVFMSACSQKDYRNRVWYCAANDPSYFPDTNFMEVGADDKAVMGLIKIGSYLGIVKMGSGTEASVYLAYPTSFEEETTYAVKQSVSGAGAISNGAFNILSEEPLFLSDRGVMGVNVSESDSGKQIRNRSFFVNDRLRKETNLGNAISYVINNMYYLAINGRCYVLDGSQKSSWANEKTNLQYECYYLENIPAQCFAEMGDDLYFTDFNGALCRFKTVDDPKPYVDAYLVEKPQWEAVNPPVLDEFVIKELIGTTGEAARLTDSGRDYLTDESGNRFLVMVGSAQVGDAVRYDDTDYTVDYVLDGKAHVQLGVPVYSRWSTVSDDDGMVHYFKNMTKKGVVVSLMPESNNGVDIYLKPDEKDPIYLGRQYVGKSTLPYDVFIRKKIKKYKRLQIICENNVYNDGFALDQIIKTYTVGNYSKNRG